MNETIYKTKGPCGPNRSPGTSSCLKNMIFCGKCINDPSLGNWPLWYNKQFYRVSIHYHTQSVLDELWKPGHDLY